MKADLSEAISFLEHLVASGHKVPLVDQIRQATNGNHALGNARFQEEIEAALGRRAKRGAPGRPRQSAS